MRTGNVVLGLLVLLAISGWHLVAAEPATPSATVATPADIAGWVKDLDSSAFTTRQTAARRLYEAGPSAIDELAKAAGSESLEVTRQSLDLLRRFHDSGDASIREKATAALKKLAEGENKSAAARASEILKKPEDNTANQPQIAPFGGVGRVQIGGIRVQAQAANGNKNIEVDENGVKIKIAEDKDSIKVTKTEKVNGQDQTDTYDAKDLDELKKKHPEGAKIYEKYAKQGNVIVGGNGGIQIQIQGQAIPIGGGAIPVPAIPVPNGPQGGIQILPFAPNQDVAKKAMENAEKSLEDLKEKIKSSGLPKDQLEKLIDQIEASRKQMAEAREKLGG